MMGSGSGLPQPGTAVVNLSLSLCREKTKVTKASQGVEDGPDTKKVKLDSTETTMVKKVRDSAPVSHQRAPMLQGNVKSTSR